MCRDQMMKRIGDMLEDADDKTLESFYWFLIMEIEE
jgi:hypothetical protein